MDAEHTGRPQCGAAPLCQNLPCKRCSGLAPTAFSSGAAAWSLLPSSSGSVRLSRSFCHCVNAVECASVSPPIQQDYKLWAVLGGLRQESCQQTPLVPHSSASTTIHTAPCLPACPSDHSTLRSCQVLLSSCPRSPD